MCKLLEIVGAFHIFQLKFKTRPFSLAAQWVPSLKLNGMLKVKDTKPKYWSLYNLQKECMEIIRINTVWNRGNKLVAKLFTISNWDASCLYCISIQTYVGCYVWS